VQVTVIVFDPTLRATAEALQVVPTTLADPLAPPATEYAQDDTVKVVVAVPLRSIVVADPLS
jgi:hypothetical protein